VENFNYLSHQPPKSEVLEHIKANCLQYDSLKEGARKKMRMTQRRTAQSQGDIILIPDILKMAKM
jgi:hypothetical protein